MDGAFGHGKRISLDHLVPNPNAKITGQCFKCNNLTSIVLTPLARVLGAGADGLFVEHKTRRVAGKAILRLNHVAIADLAAQAHIAIELQLAVGKSVDILLLGQDALDNDRVALLFLLLLEGLEQGRGLLPAYTSGIGDTHQFPLAIAQ